MTDDCHLSTQLAISDLAPNLSDAPNIMSFAYYLLNPKNPTPPKLRFVSPPRERGGVRGGVQ